MRERLPENAFSILTHAAVAVRLSEIAGLRESPALPKRFLRYCDEQAVVGMAAVLRAIDRLTQPRPSFDRWGVVSASCQPGRIMGASALIGTRAIGSQGVSPHVVPQCSLHSPASAVSVGLSMHGPHFGIGGGAEAFDEAMLTACSMLSPADPEFGEENPSGGWLILTAWDREPSLDAAGATMSDPTCHGLAVAILPGAVGAAEATIAVVPSGADRSPADAGLPSRSPADSIQGLAAILGEGPDERRARLPLRHGFSLDVRRLVPASPLALEAA